VDDETLEVVVGTLLLARGWSLACAESLTGGALGSRISSTPGASEYFRGSIVAYATDVKEDVLGVPGWVLEEHGPVSEPVARAMASGARDRLKADVAVALTGVAGPSEQGRPVGTVVIAVAGPLGEVVREVRLPGDRNTVRTLAVSGGLNLVRLYLLEAT
jgi:PncC family amidohydrolase